MPRIHVCSLARLEETVAASGSEHVLSVLGAHAEVERPARIAPQRHRIVRVSDIVAPNPGQILPTQAHIAEILDFVRGWERAAPMTIHCYAGVSRSTAAAYIAACALRPDLDEAGLARLLRARSPSATPNALFVALADAMLAREGRMVAAIAAIGRGVDCYEGAPFHLDLGGEAA